MKGRRAEQRHAEDLANEERGADKRSAEETILTAGIFVRYRLHHITIKQEEKEDAEECRVEERLVEERRAEERRAEERRLW